MSCGPRFQPVRLSSNKLKGRDICIHVAILPPESSIAQIVASNIKIYLVLMTRRRTLVLKCASVANDGSISNNVSCLKGLYLI